jgi:hypothetical protein
MTTILKAVVKAYDAPTHTATVRAAGSTPAYLTAIPVATNIPAAAVVAGRECSLLALDPHNPTDTLILSIQGALPPAGGGGVQTTIADADADTYVRTEQAADEDKVRAAVAGTERFLLQTALPHALLTGNVQVSATLGVATAPLTYRLLQAAGTIAPSVFGCAAGGFDIHSNHVSGARNTVGLIGAAFGGGTGTGTNSGIYGLYFLAATESPNATAYLGAIYAYIQSTAAGSGAITVARGLQMPAASWVGAKPATVHCADFADQGGAGVGTAYGLTIADQTATTVRLLELGPVTPYLRLTGGAAPGAGLTNLYLNEGGNLRRVQWVDPGAGGANLVAGQRVMVLV